MQLKYFFNLLWNQWHNVKQTTCSCYKYWTQFLLSNLASKSSTQKDRSSINEGWSLIWLCYQVQVHRHVVTSWYSPQLSGHLVIFSAATWSPRDILRSYVVTKWYSPRPRGHLEIFSASTWSPRDILRVHVITSWHSLRPRGHLVIMFRSTAMWSPLDIVTHITIFANHHVSIIIEMSPRHKSVHFQASQMATFLKICSNLWHYNCHHF